MRPRHPSHAYDLPGHHRSPDRLSSRSDLRHRGRQRSCRFRQRRGCHRMRRRNSGRYSEGECGPTADEQMRFRIGVHVGDIIVQGDNLFGDGVNIAARLEALAEPGGICVSGTVRDQIGTKLPVVRHRSRRAAGEKHRSADQGVSRPKLAGSPRGTPYMSALTSPLPDKPSIAVLPFPKHERRSRAGLFRGRYG